MPIQLDKARKLIADLEVKLNETSVQAAHARKVLDEWLQSGEAILRKKGASALKQVRKRADGFVKSLAEWEKNMGESMEKMAASMEKEKKAKKPQVEAKQTATAPSLEGMKSPTKKGPAKKSPARKGPVKKTPTRKRAAKKAPARKSPAVRKKTAAAKVPE